MEQNRDKGNYIEKRSKKENGKESEVNLEKVVRYEDLDQAHGIQDL